MITWIYSRLHTKLAQYMAVLAGSEEHGWVWIDADGIHVNHHGQHELVSNSEIYRDFVIVGGRELIVAKSNVWRGFREPTIMTFHVTTRQMSFAQVPAAKHVVVTDNYMFVLSDGCLMLDIYRLSDLRIEEMVTVRGYGTLFAMVVLRALPGNQVAVSNELNYISVYGKLDNKWRLLRTTDIMAHFLPVFCAEHDRHLIVPIPETAVTSLCMCTANQPSYYVTRNNGKCMLYMGRELIWTFPAIALHLSRQGLTVVFPNNNVGTFALSYPSRLAALFLSDKVPVSLIKQIKKYIV